MSRLEYRERFPVYVHPRSISKQISLKQHTSVALLLSTIKTYGTRAGCTSRCVVIHWMCGELVKTLDIRTVGNVTWGPRRLKSTRLFIEQMNQTATKQNIKAPHCWTLCEGKPVTVDSPHAQRASNAEGDSILWWRVVTGLPAHIGYYPQ